AVLAPGAPSADISADTIIDATGKIVMPGFISGHNHLWQSAFRGLAADQELYGWLGALHWTYGDLFVDGDFYTFTLHGALEQLSRGITTTYNHSQRLRGSESQYMESFQAGLDAPQHFIFSYNANVRQPDAKIISDVDRFVKMANKQIGASSLLGVSIHSVGLYTGADKLKVEMQLAQKHQLTAQIHYLEEYQRRFRERKNWPMLRAAGAVRDGVTYAHFIHTTDQIITEAAAAGAAMIWNPLSNGRLASGLVDVPRYLEAGLQIGMGVDGAASADVADPFENMRMGMYALRMQHRSATVMSPIEVLRMHTLATARVLKVDDRVGSLEPGKYADFLLIQPPAGTLFDIASTLVLATQAADIESVFVRGQPVVDGGRVPGHDMVALRNDLLTRVARIVAAAEEAD
ncbi:MAG: amidohydrolase family protein, partial [Pseudomonadota bacterium]